MYFLTYFKFWIFLLFGISLHKTRSVWHHSMLKIKNVKLSIKCNSNFFILVYQLLHLICIHTVQVVQYCMFHKDLEDYFSEAYRGFHFGIKFDLWPLCDLYKLNRVMWLCIYGKSCHMTSMFNMMFWLYTLMSLRYSR